MFTVTLVGGGTRGKYCLPIRRKKKKAMILASTYSYTRRLDITGYTHRIYFGEQGTVGTSSFQRLSFIAAARERSQATVTSTEIIILMFS